MSSPVILHPCEPARFALSLAEARRHDGRIAAYVSPISVADAWIMATQGTRFLGIRSHADSEPYYSAGAYVTADGYFGGLFSRVPGYGSALIVRAVELGATHLDCLGDGLAGLYARHGFSETFRAPWDDAQAPDDWNTRPERPDYIEMRLDK